MGRSDIPRTLAELLTSLDHRLYLLREALHALAEDPAHLKSLSVELRTLICKSSGTEGLLWRLADELHVSDSIELHVAESVNRDHPLNRGLAVAKLPLSRAGEGPPGPPAAHHRLRDVIKTCEAIYIAAFPDRRLTHELLIKAVADQMGAHEDSGLDPVLVRLSKFLINRAPLYIPILTFDAELTLQVGERVLEFAEQERRFVRAPRRSEYGDLTLCMRFALDQPLAGRVPIIALRSPIAEVEITCFAGPGSVVFALTKHGTCIGEFKAPYPEPWDHRAGACFAMSYSSAHRKVRTITNGKVNGEPAECNCGWLDARELRGQPYIAYKGFLRSSIRLYSRHLSSQECEMLSRLSVDETELLADGSSGGPFPP